MTIDETVKLLWVMTHMVRHIGLATLCAAGTNYVIPWAGGQFSPPIASLVIISYLALIFMINLWYSMYWISLLENKSDQLEFDIVGVRCE